MGALPPVFIEFLGKSTGLHATTAAVRRDLATTESEGAGQMSRLSTVSKAALLGIGIAASVAAVKTVHMAADFQTQMTRVRTGAGELQKNMASVSSGILSMAGEVGQSTQELTSGLYMVESAGYHGADALKVLKVSAEGAKVGAADMASVTDAVTTALNAYKLGAGDVTHVMNALVATEASGKTNMEALAGSMSSILPVAAAAHVGLNEVLGAMATMTSQGTSAKVAATYLRQTIGQLSNPSAKAAGEMRDLGLDSTQVALSLGKKGLAATLMMLTDAIQKHMGPAGTVLIDKLKSVSGNATAFQKVLANLPETQQSYIGALATMVGGTKSMMGALQLTGPHLETFKANVKTIGQHVKDGGKDVEGWSDVQKTFNQRMAEAKGSMQGLGISIGLALLPAAMKFMDVIAKLAMFMNKNHSALLAFGIALTAVAIGLTVAKIASWDFNASLYADPLTWIVVGIVLLVAALVMLVMHWKQVAAWLAGAWHATVNGLAAAWHWLASETVSVWDNYIVAPVLAAWHAIANFFAGAYHTVVDPVMSAWRRVWSVTQTIWNGITGFFRKWWPLLFVIMFPFLAALVALWNHTHTAVFNFAKSVWGAIAGFFVAVWNTVILPAARIAWAIIRDAVVNPARDTYKFLASIWNTAYHWLSAKWAEIHSTAAGWFNSIRNAMTGPINSAYNTLKGILSKIQKAISDQLTQAWNDVKNIGSKFLSIGSSIVEGIVKGIVRNASSIGGALKDAADGALKDASSFLDINSPSKVAAKRLGSPLSEGIAKGITDNAHLAHRAMRRMSAELVAGGMGGPQGELSVGTSGGGVTVIHQTNVSVVNHGSVLAENDLVQTIKKVMPRDGARNSTTYKPYKR
jgi:phage tail tape measure protein, TP901 family, core region